MENVKVRCSNCSAELNVDDLFVKQFEESIRKELQAELKKQQIEFGHQKEVFKNEQKRLEQEKINIEDLVQSRVQNIIKDKEIAIRESIRKQIEEEKITQLQLLEDELVQKSKQLQELNATKAKFERLKREMEERETAIILEKEKELSERLTEARQNIKEQLHQESFLKIREREKIIEDLKKRLEEAKNKAEQGSIQLQGQIQELSIIDILRDIHPYDDIVQTKTGTNGADIYQTVKTQNGDTCGTVYYESKSTRTYSKEWIPKFKQDNVNAKADILILVTNALPKGIERYGIIDGVWVCRFQDIKELSLALRYGLLKLRQVIITQQGKESKMELLYRYLTSEEFKNVFSSIIEGFRNLQDLHNGEKLKMQRLWKEREKILEKTLLNSVEFYGSIKGIAGASIPPIEMLELPKAS